MKILVIGGGGREHALCWRFVQSSLRHEVYAAPGNPGIAQIATCLSASDALELARSIQPDLTVVGPEAPLVTGVVDTFRAAGLAIFGPAAAAAQLEGSKIYAKDFFTRLGIPTARYRAVDGPAAAHDALKHFDYPVVLKADGLAAGKGVIIARSPAEADAALATLTGRVVIEEFLSGEEVSFIAICDGRTAVPLEPTQDHKAVFDDDTGPNTGGMGAYCDSRILTPAQTEEIMKRVIRPTVAASGFTGFLYAGLMMTANGPKVLEFNVRLGDPETQPLMHRIRGDFAETLLAAARGELPEAPLQWATEPSVCVVLTSQGYPGSYATGLPITGIDSAEQSGATVFHAGTRQGSRGLETSGGRVLGVTTSGAGLPEAIERAYAALHHIHFPGMHYRTDIGRKGIKRWR